MIVVSRATCRTWRAFLFADGTCVVRGLHACIALGGHGGSARRLIARDALRERIVAALASDVPVLRWSEVAP